MRVRSDSPVGAHRPVIIRPTAMRPGSLGQAMSAERLAWQCREAVMGDRPASRGPASTSKPQHIAPLWLAQEEQGQGRSSSAGARCAGAEGGMHNVNRMPQAVLRQEELKADNQLRSDNHQHVGSQVLAMPSGMAGEKTDACETHSQKSRPSSTSSVSTTTGLVIDHKRQHRMYRTQGQWHSTAYVDPNVAAPIYVRSRSSSCTHSHSHRSAFTPVQRHTVQS